MLLPMNMCQQWNMKQHRRICLLQFLAMKFIGVMTVKVRHFCGVI